MIAVALAVLLLVPHAAARPEDRGDTDTAAVERAVFEGVNATRKREGLAPLAADDTLTRIARDHSCAMARAGVLQHTAPDGKSLGARVRNAGLRYAAVGENIARIDGHDAPARAIRGWLESEGHRANIMSPEFTRSGVGACRAGRTLYLTQAFLRPR